MAFIQDPPDGGMLYAETNLNHLFPEPLNAVTSIFFLGIAIYWTIKLWGRQHEHTFLSFALVLLYVGGVGGTIYHGLRQWHFFILMDWLPIMALCVCAGVFFLAKVIRWYLALAFVLVYAFFQFYIREEMPKHDMQLYININYGAMAGIVLLPVLAYLLSTKFVHGKWVGFALVCFILALTFRVADGWGWLSMGTHFLWHTLGAVAAFCMFQYIYLVNEEPAKNIFAKKKKHEKVH